MQYYHDVITLPYVMYDVTIIYVTVTKQCNSVTAM